jgi:hypothetical protein
MQYFYAILKSSYTDARRRLDNAGNVRVQSLRNPVVTI